MERRLKRCYVACLVVLLFVGLAFRAEAQIDPEDASILSELAETWPSMTSGLDSWDINTVNNACTAWRGIRCDALYMPGKVTHLNLSSESLGTPLPPAILNLTALSVLSITSSGLTGNLYPDWSSLSNLTTLSLSNNSLAGALSAGMDSLRSLEVLALDQNRLDGTFPPSLRNLTELRFINISSNRGIRGIFLSSIESWPKLEVVSITTSRFSIYSDPTPPDFLHFCISPGVGQLTSLRHLDVSSSGLAAEFPPEISELEALEYFRFDSNFGLSMFPNVTRLARLKTLIGSFTSANMPSLQLPNDIDGMESLETLIIKGTMILNGTLPASIGNLKNLTYLDLSRNRLSGSMPESLGFLNKLTYLDLSRNVNLGGALPVSLGPGNPELKTLILSACNITSISSSIGQASALEYLALDQNSLSGQIPEEIGDLVKLRILTIAYNQLSGALPQTLGNLENLESLDLTNNQLDGLFNFSKLTKLERFVAIDAGLRGAFPVEISSLTQLQALQLSSNNISGPLPEDIGELRELKVLNLDNNQMSGQLPESLFSLTNLTSLSLVHNRFNGTLSDSIGSLTKLRSLLLSYNELSGSIPPSIFSLLYISTDLSLAHNKFNGSIPAEAANFSFGVDLSYNELTGGLPDSFEHATLPSIYLVGNRLRFCETPTNISSLPPLLACTFGRQRSAWDCGCTSKVFDHCLTVPEPLGPCIPCAGPSPSSILPFECQDGKWVLDLITLGSSAEGSLVIQDGAIVFVIGDIVVPLVTYNGLAGTFNISQGCVNLTQVLVNLSDEDIEELYESNQLSKILVSTPGARNCSLRGVTVTLSSSGKSCRKVTLSGIESDATTLSSTFAIDSSMCNKKSKIWWIVLVSVVGGIVLLVGAFALLASFHPRVKAWVRPFWTRQKGNRPPISGYDIS